MSKDLQLIKINPVAAYMLNMAVKEKKANLSFAMIKGIYVYNKYVVAAAKTQMRFTTRENLRIGETKKGFYSFKGMDKTHYHLCLDENMRMLEYKKVYNIEADTRQAKDTSPVIEISTPGDLKAQSLFIGRLAQFKGCILDLKLIQDIFKLKNIKPFKLIYAPPRNDVNCNKEVQCSDPLIFRNGFDTGLVIAPLRDYVE